MKSKSAFIIKRMIPFIFFMAMLLVNENAWAQNIPSPFRSTDEEIKAYLKNKYVVREINIHAAYYDDERGLAKIVIVTGNLTPKTAPPGNNGRAIAQAFFAEEAALFEITHMSEMREESKKEMAQFDQLGNIGLRYYHYINGIKVDGTEALIYISPDGIIYYLSAGITPISPQLLEAVKKPTLSDQQIRSIIKQDMLSSNIDTRLFPDLDLRKAVVPFAPYVVWKGDAQGEGERWLLTIDAFTGQIIDKTYYW